MFDRKLLAKLSRCAWKVLNLYLTQAIPYDDAKAGAAVAVQSFGDFQNFNSHLHVIYTDPPEADYYGNGSFKACPTPHPKDLEDLFRFEVLKMLKSEGKINDLIDSDLSPQAFRKNWARLIQKIYPVKFPKGNPIEQGK